MKHKCREMSLMLSGARQEVLCTCGHPRMLRTAPDVCSALNPAHPSKQASAVQCVSSASIRHGISCQSMTAFARQAWGYTWR